MVEAVGLEHHYESRPVVRAEHFAAYGGTITAIVGPSGAGKSTLLRLLAGLEPPSYGTLRDGQGHALTPTDLRARTSLVMQQPLALRGTVLYNAALAPRLAGASRRRANETAEQMLTRVGLASLAQRSARKLSGGELVRLAVARALAKQPALLLLDEATANLDPGNIKRLETIIRDVANSGTAVVMITHNLPQARRLSDQTALVLGGQLIVQHDTEQFFGGDHDDPRVWAFVSGEMIF
ncbi:MAG: ATP-binding cassette domain-containing protein [Trueperaceae bacterium]|nr:ATP-binding cassette domain-containing protein [Trueperaceae bacterium]